ncbi:hypothetical protein NADFUDRAFT_81548 [Nadsonia fulvescens var. elongata DSM 6958]|uniref:Uncharacterized protein n=1 Tax=Nadsonia fulvescens var. elongata DSM 6958 TaxID=857566 RepID=A0A1E3PTB7_9ASCO|nr:hypothetical protein NADFUDRAFT_81548 [Nadsonia fulvescens var. elongata DSM 6958]
MQLFNSKSQKAKLAAVIGIIVTLGPVSAQFESINSLLSQVSQDLVDGRSADIPSSQASSEVSSFIAAITGNSDVTNMFKSFYSYAANTANAINTDGLIELAQQASSSLAAYGDSDDFKTLQSLIAVKSSNYDLNLVGTNIMEEFGKYSAMVTTQASLLTSISPELKSAVVGFYDEATIIGYAAAYGYDANVLSTSTNASSSAATSSVDRPNDANVGAVGGAFVIGGALIAVANYLL